MEFDYFIIFIFLLEVNLLDKLKWINEWEWCKYVWVFKLRKSFGAQARRSVRRWETTRLRRGQIFKDPQRSRASLDLNPEARGAIDFLFLSYSPSLFRLTSRFLLLAVAFVYSILISLLRICPGLRKPCEVQVLCPIYSLTSRLNFIPTSWNCSSFSETSEISVSIFINIYET